MILRIYFLIVGFSITKAVPNKAQISYFKENNNKAIKWPPYHGPTYTTGIVLDKSATPYILGMFVSGNGVTDEFHVNVHKVGDVRNLLVYNTVDKIIFNLPTHFLTVINEKSEPGSLIVIENDVCTRSKYDEKNPMLKISEEVFEGDTCSETIRLVKKTKKEEVPIKWYFMFFEHSDDNLARWPPQNGPTYTTGIVLDKSTTPHTLGMFLSGNGVTDELYVKVNKPGEARKLLVYNNEDRIIFNLPKNNFAAISRKTEPGILIVIENGKCIKRKYDMSNSRLKLSEEEVDLTTFKEALDLVENTKKNDVPIEWNMLFLESSDDEITKWPLNIGPTFMSGIVLDKSTTPLTLGVFVSGNGVKDELHIKIDEAGDARTTEVYNTEDTLIIYLKAYSYLAISKKSERATLTVMKEGVCTKRKYDEKNLSVKLPEEQIDANTCFELFTSAEEIVTNSVASKWYTLFYEYPDEKLIKWSPHFGPTYLHGVSLDKSTSQFTLGMFVSGNGVTDELHLNIDSEGDVRNLQVYNTENQIVFDYPIKGFTAISQKTERGILDVIEKAKCTRRKYDVQNPGLKLSEEELKPETCATIIKTVENVKQNTLPVKWYSMFFRKADVDFKKWRPQFGTTFINGVVIDMTSKPYTLGMFVAGNGIADELYVPVNTVGEARSLKIYNNKYLTIFSLVKLVYKPAYKFDAISKSTEPGVLMVIENEKCTKRKYDITKPSVKLSEEVLDGSSCRNVIKMVEDAKQSTVPLKWYTLFFEKSYSELIKWPAYNGPRYANGISVDKSTSPFTLGMFVSGNKIKDEFHIKVDKIGEARNLLMYNSDDQMVLYVPSRKFTVVSTKADPGVVVTIEDKTCKKLRYNEDNESYDKLAILYGEIEDEADSITNSVEEKIDNKKCLDTINLVNKIKKNALPVNWYTLFYEDPQDEVKQWSPQYGPTYINGISLDYSTHPYTLGMFVSGNGIDDELRVKVDKKWEARGLLVYNSKDRIIFNLPSHKFSAISKEAEPGTLVVVEDNKCTRRKYNMGNLNPDRESVDSKTCNGIVKEINDAELREVPLKWYLLFNEDPDENIMRWPIHYGPRYVDCVLLDKSTTPHTLAMFISGNGVKDELQVKVKDGLEAENVKVYNNNERIIFDLPTQRFSAVNKKTEPGTLIVIENGKCTKRKYIKGDYLSKPQEEQVDAKTCTEAIQLIKDAEDNDNPRESRLTFFEDSNDKLKREKPHYGGLYTDCIILDKSTLPYTLGMFINGNGILDELYMKVKSEQDAKNVEVYRDKDQIIFNMPSHSFAAANFKSEPGIMTVIDNGKCTKWIYDEANPRLKPSAEAVDQDTCKEIRSQIKNSRPKAVHFESPILFFEDGNANLIKKKPTYGGTYTDCIVLDKGTLPYTLGIFVSGNGILDELRIDVDRIEEMNDVEVYRNEDKIIFNLPSRKFSAISQNKNPGSMIIIENDKCKMRKYNKKNPRLMPIEKSVDEETCKEMMQLVRFANLKTIPILSPISFFDSDVVKIKQRFGGTYTTCIVLDKKKTPFTLGMFVSGNGIVDELQVKVDKAEEANEVRVKNTNDEIIYNFPTHNFAAISRKSEPGNLIAIEDGKCTRKIYDEQEPRLVLVKRPVDEKTCTSTINHIERETAISNPLASDFLFYREESDDLQKNDAFYGQTFTSCIVLDKSTTPYTLGMFVSGNGVLDELQLEVDNEKDAMDMNVYNQVDQIVFKLPSYNFAAISKTTEPSTLTVYKKGKCKKFKYSEINPRQRPEKEKVADDECMDLMQQIGMSKFRKAGHLKKKKDKKRKKEKKEKGGKTKKKKKGEKKSKKDKDEEVKEADKEDDDDELEKTDKKDKAAKKQKKDEDTKSDNEETADKKQKKDKESKAGKKDKPHKKPKENKNNNADITVEHYKNVKDNLLYKFYMAGMKFKKDKEKKSGNKDKTTKKEKEDKEENKDKYEKKDKEKKGTKDRNKDKKNTMIENEKTNKGNLKKLMEIHEEMFEASAHLNSAKKLAKIKENGKSQPDSKSDWDPEKATVDLLLGLPRVLKWNMNVGKTFTYGTLLEAKGRSYSLGVYLKGNNIEDVLHLEINSEYELENLQVNNLPDKIQLYLPTVDFLVASDTNTPGELIVMKDDTCIRRIYNDKPKYKPSKEVIDFAICKAIKDTIHFLDYALNDNLGTIVHLRKEEVEPELNDRDIHIT